MSEWIACYDKKADTPYLLKTIGKNIYAIEELCFYFWQYSHLLGESYMEEELIAWIRGPLGLVPLADQLEQMLQSNAAKEELVKTLFRTTGYLTEQELSEYMEEIKKIQNLTPFERDKCMADDFVRNEQYYKALQEYSRLLKQEEAQGEVASELYHNMGVANSKMFLFEQASECFLQAFLLAPNQESLRQYKLAIRLSEEEIEEDTMVKEFPGVASIDLQVYQDLQAILRRKQGKIREVEELQLLKEEGKIAEYYRKLQEVMQKWQEECRGYMNHR